MSEITGSNPRTGAPTPGVRATSIQEAAALMDRAAEASCHWSGLPHVERGRLLKLVAGGLDEHRDEVVTAAEAETALGRERLTGEVQRTTGQLRLFADEIEAGHHLRVLVTEADPAAGIPDLRRMQVPRGPVAVFAASNFPLAFSVAGGDTASALAAGCPVVVKAHENHPHTSELVADVIRSVLPQGVFGLVHGQAAGAVLVSHTATTAVGFTGSLSGGLALQRLCQARKVPIPFFGEMSSVNPIVVMPDAAASEGPRIARDFVASMTLGNGQYCTKPALLFVPEESRLPDTVAEVVRTTKTGALLTPGIRDHYLHHSQHDLSLLARGEAEDNVALAVAAEVRMVRGAGFADALPALSGERFGPAAVVVTYASQVDLLNQLALLPGALAGAIHSSNATPEVAAVGNILRRRVGRLIHNGWPTGVAVALAQHHGGPYPATTNDSHTSVGATAIDRWLVPVTYQDWPDDLLPPELQRANPLGLPRRLH